MGHSIDRLHVSTRGFSAQETTVVSHPAEGGQRLDAFPVEPGKTQPRLVTVYWRLQQLLRRRQSRSNADVNFLTERVLTVGQTVHYKAFNDIHVQVNDGNMAITVTAQKPRDPLFTVDPTGTLITEYQSPLTVVITPGGTNDTFPIVRRVRGSNPPRYHISQAVEFIPRITSFPERGELSKQ